MRLRLRLPTLAALLLTTTLASACVRRLPDADPGDIPEIRQSLTQNPDDVELQTRLGVALHKAGDHAQAVEVLDAAIEDGAGSGAAYLYLGLSHEALEDWSGARQAYSRYLELGRSDPLKDEMRGRLAMMVRRELQEEARRALEQEAQISAQPPTPRSVAVFPLRYVEGPEELRPLQVAMADMMITDLNTPGDLTVLERVRVQTLLDEMALTDAGLTQAGTGARAGRVLRSEHVVQGALTALGDQGIRLDADVLDTRQGASIDQVLAEDQLEAIFDVEKAAVFGILDALGVELTAAERETIDENRAASLLAFLAYGRGLQAMDRGDYAAAEEAFSEAQRLDPSFEPAGTALEEAVDLGETADTPIQEVADRGDEEVQLEGSFSGTTTVLTEGGEVTATTEVATTLTHVGEGLDPTPNTGTIDRASPSAPQPGEAPPEQEETQQTQTKRQPVPESAGTEQPTGKPTATVRITIRRPTGGGGDR